MGSQNKQSELPTDKEAKNPSYSETIKTEVVCPNDTNPMGILQGGRLVQWMDIAAAVCAQTHADGICVTASIDAVRFYHSAKVGDILTIKARITRAFTTSMEIRVEAFVRSVYNPTPRSLSTAYFTFVAIDEQAKKRTVPPVIAESEEDKHNYNLAALRKEKNSTPQ
ncbi:MAG: hypothetical protein OJF59_002085 [Cytophagales bacterium]|jgi:acyl-CoA hydrolase|nr:acyl-CoA thioesterase [Bacteroidota bacterium]MBS1980973.1 acyl-CoA thioesterase [Bacteroidota bacterium]WHZ08332.1 MAG: hypothetical protein OJF59_002085 [Cytophagales bacterium]